MFIDASGEKNKFLRTTRDEIGVVKSSLMCADHIHKRERRVMDASMHYVLKDDWVDHNYARQGLM